MSYRYPFPPYPIGWYRILRASDLAPNRIRTVHYLGRELVVFRNSGGKVAVFDAACPHLGAHLGQGKVVGDAIQCVFHGWRYDVTGACVHAPGVGKIPPRARARSWPVDEVNDAILIWYHPRNEAPTWHIPPMPELSDPAWYSAPGPRWPRIRTHVADALENGMDLSHFSHLHSQQTLSADSLAMELVGHELIHRTYQRYNLFGLAKLWIDEVGGPLDVHLWGLGLAINRTVVHAKVDLRYAFAFYFTPIDDEHVEVTSTLAIERQKSRLLTRLLWHKAAREAKYTLDQDVPIWEAKTYQSQPALGEHDGPIGAYRRWIRQFYEPAAASGVESWPADAAAARERRSG